MAIKQDTITKNRTGVIKSPKANPKNTSVRTKVSNRVVPSGYSGIALGEIQTIVASPDKPFPEEVLVKGEFKKGEKPSDVLKSLFPTGSKITSAKEIRKKAWQRKS